MTFPCCHSHWNTSVLHSSKLATQTLWCGLALILSVVLIIVTLICVSILSLSLWKVKSHIPLWLCTWGVCIRTPSVFTHVRQPLKIGASAARIQSVQSLSCPTLRDPMDCSTPDFPVPHQLPELAQTHVHRVGDAIHPSHPLSSPSPPAFDLSHHQSLFQWVSSSHQVAKVLEFQLQNQSFQWIFRTDLLKVSFRTFFYCPQYSD